jgi:PRC-barrel domain
MAHLGTLRTFRFNDDVDDIRGADIYGRNDEKLGEINDVIFDHDTGQIQYAVVDAGGWMSNKKFIVPADRIRERAGHDDDFSVDLTQDQIRDFPEYNDSSVEDRDQFRNYESNYRAKWDEGPVLHKEGSVNIITPEPDEMPPATGSTGNMDVTPTRIAGKFPDTAPDSSKLRMRPAGTAADAEDTRLPGATRGSGDLGTGGLGAGTGNSARDMNPDDVGYGNIDRTAVPAGHTRDLPPSYRETVDGQLDASNDLHRPYPVQEGRHRRWAAFEDHLRRNRVDVTSSCRACDNERDKAA